MKPKTITQHYSINQYALKPVKSYQTMNRKELIHYLTCLNNANKRLKEKITKLIIDLDYNYRQIKQLETKIEGNRKAGNNAKAREWRIKRKVRE